MIRNKILYLLFLPVFFIHIPPQNNASSLLRPERSRTGREGEHQPRSERMPLDPSPLTLYNALMDTFDAIALRSSVRAYSTKKVGREALEKLVDAGRRAPTARAVEPWEFVVVTDKKILEELGRTADHGPFIKDAAACIAVFCADTKYYLEDGCAATENILIAASDMGIGACWVAGDKKPYAGAVAAILGAPAGQKLISLISIGFAKTSPKQAKHRELSDVLHWEKFQRKA